MRGGLCALLLLLLLAPLPVDARCVVHRSQAVRRAFQRAHPCPSTQRTTGACPHFIADHIQALACGGLDEVANLQWSTVAEAKAKDVWERKGCHNCQPARRE